MDQTVSRAADDRDAVTGLPDRDLAAGRLGDWLARGEPVHALLVGLKRLDTVMLAYGTTGGDMLLGEVAARIRHFAQDELGGEAIVARGAAGTFLVLAARACSREHWQHFATQLLAILARPVVIAGAQLRLTPRAALLRATAEDSGAEAVLDGLEEALGKLSAQSAQRLIWADGAALRDRGRAAELDADLLHAFERGEIEVLYQPQVACDDGRLLGAEALARWNHPELGRIGASALFAIAERADQQAALATHIAARALSDARAWPALLRLSLNVTPGELADSEFARRLSAMIGSSGFSPERLTLEVTEQVLVSDVALAAQVLAGLHDQGVAVALDDFGAGFCNFRYLRLLPLDYLKLDRSMIEDAAGDVRDRAVLRAIVAMANALDLKVVAEGIESEGQRRLVEDEGCHSWQGFLKAPPLTAVQFAALA